ncbi:rhodanese-like domain-containing protein [Lutimonas zeaxanthinifaciens]|uniref:rhodanese-like domain-containing protein n=1 Tax=Lutimonas zeaxanthinifaciens TaxID=3060215 RepID=UPI00265D52B9|nr:rhodanese-like domain-containing protein [Lutimonas sp. YSD2104]WKK66138.1 rhodanese-like domain-containing protein [Lutimonas sp. YSD2104]
MKAFKSTLLFLLVSSVLFVSCEQKKGSNDTLITPAELNQANKDILLIDVRTPEEYASGHIENAVNIDFYADNFQEQIEVLDRSQPVYVYCKKGGRSSNAAQKMKDMGFKSVYDLDGGILQWEQEGFKTVK